LGQFEFTLKFEIEYGRKHKGVGWLVGWWGMAARQSILDLSKESMDEGS
jgi:hypothetical protein